MASLSYAPGITRPLPNPPPPLPYSSLPFLPQPLCTDPTLSPVSPSSILCPSLPLLVSFPPPVPSQPFPRRSNPLAESTPIFDPPILSIKSSPYRESSAILYLRRDAGISESRQGKGCGDEAREGDGFARYPRCSCHPVDIGRFGFPLGACGRISPPRCPLGYRTSCIDRGPPRESSPSEIGGK